MISQYQFSWFFSSYVSFIGFAVSYIVFRIQRRFYWYIGHWILMRLARFQKSQNIERAIQMSYFLILEMINKSQIHTCFESIIIDINIKFILPSLAVWIHLRAVLFFWAICHKQSRDLYRQNLSWRGFLDFSHDMYS